MKYRYCESKHYQILIRFFFYQTNNHNVLFYLCSKFYWYWLVQLFHIHVQIWNFTLRKNNRFHQSSTSKRFKRNWVMIYEIFQYRIIVMWYLIFWSFYREFKIVWDKLTQYEIFSFKKGWYFLQKHNKTGGNSWLKLLVKFLLFFPRIVKNVMRINTNNPFK